ncbi:MAG: putative tRNA threonylcarbamoyladenosine biosynthesis protein Gcp [Candidatus Peregrinibacteria bacterium GW2011_GWA2_43_8]|nr:MAG: putative tRNA threonylcarbamoyladenosine biosynthesis protein Gcp [Candidatus Peregrinibacteria bacterium GW2011_GWA2_43_8]
MVFFSKMSRVNLPKMRFVTSCNGKLYKICRMTGGRPGTAIIIFAMKILAFETSCDETAVAVVENGTKVLSNVIFSQIDLHKELGGVVPEIAAREHILKIIPVLDEALRVAKVGFDDIDAIAVTKEPGLISSLLTGIVTASTVLTVSGGHNELVLMKGHCDFEVLGETLDDAAGEAFDKVARLLELGYPGGPAISKIAEKGTAKYKFPRAWLGKDSFDFSFSGLKSEVARVIAKNELTDEFKADCAGSFEEAVCDVLSEKLIRAARKFGAKEVHLAGGVSANKRLRKMVAERLGTEAILRCPTRIEYCTDNGAMVAGAGYFMASRNLKKSI